MAHYCFIKERHYIDNKRDSYRTNFYEVKLREIAMGGEEVSRSVIERRKLAEYG